MAVIHVRAARRLIGDPLRVAASVLRIDGSPAWQAEGAPSEVTAALCAAYHAAEGETERVERVLSKAARVATEQVFAVQVMT